MGLEEAVEQRLRGSPADLFEAQRPELRQGAVHGRRVDNEGSELPMADRWAGCPPAWLGKRNVPAAVQFEQELATHSVPHGPVGLDPTPRLA